MICDCVKNNKNVWDCKDGKNCIFYKKSTMRYWAQINKELKIIQDEIFKNWHKFLIVSLVILFFYFIFNYNF